MNNETAEAIQTSANSEPHTAAVLAILALCAVVLGMFLGVSMARLPNATRRIQLQALEEFVKTQDSPTVQAICRRQIHRLQSSLGIDNDEP